MHIFFVDLGVVDYVDTEWVIWDFDTKIWEKSWSLSWSWNKKSCLGLGLENYGLGLGLGIGLDNKVLFASLPTVTFHEMPMRATKSKRKTTQVFRVVKFSVCVTLLRGYLKCVPRPAQSLFARRYSNNKTEDSALLVKPSLNCLCESLRSTIIASSDLQLARRPVLQASRAPQSVTYECVRRCYSQ